MGEFTRELTTTYIGDGLRRVVRKFEYIPDEDTGLDSVIVESGFVTDFASIPRLGRIFIPKDGDQNQAAVVHDYLYHIQTRSRRESDFIFLLALRDLGVGWLKRHIMHKAVRSWGWIPWNRRSDEIRKLRKQDANAGMENLEKSINERRKK